VISTTTIFATSSLDSEDEKEKGCNVISPISIFLSPFCVLEKNAYFFWIPEESGGELTTVSAKKKEGKESSAVSSPRPTVSRT
jgi:hypothetical protein